MTDDTPLSFHDDQAQTGPVTCSRCETQLSEYWSIDGAVFCERCKDELLAERTSPDGATARVGKAFAYGLGGMIVGALVWYAVAKFADLQLGLIAILLGWLVGKGIHYGSEKRGGLGYQVLAVLITYIGIGAASVPFVFEGMDQEIAAMTDSLAAADTVAVGEIPVDSLSDSAIAAQLAQLDSAIASGKEVDAEAVPQGAAIAIALIALLMLTVTLPVLVVTQGGSLITGIIYAIALWEAWKFAQGSPPAVSGPHSVGGDATG
jgi:hypothetical protein